MTGGVLFLRAKENALSRTGRTQIHFKIWDTLHELGKQRADSTLDEERRLRADLLGGGGLPVSRNESGFRVYYTADAKTLP